tara:strand:- start:176 stop:382 length:207 start_codon:yes stop_codon:yes gene_type:complete
MRGKKMPSSNVINPESKIPLEKRVEWDMRLLGYDPTNPQDVREFWEDRKDTDELKILARIDLGEDDDV